MVQQEQTSLVVRVCPACLLDPNLASYCQQCVAVLFEPPPCDVQPVVTVYTRVSSV